MFYWFDIEVDHGVVPVSPYTHVVRYLRGRLVRAGVYFPPGSEGLMGVRLVVGESQLYPSNIGEWICGNNIHLFWDEQAVELKPADVLKIQAYNVDPDYAHTAFVYLNILEREEVGVPVVVPGIPAWAM